MKVKRAWKGFIASAPTESRRGDIHEGKGQDHKQPGRSFTHYIALAQRGTV